LPNPSRGWPRPPAFSRSPTTHIQRPLRPLRQPSQTCSSNTRD
jgi:hypothetical protein